MQQLNIEVVYALPHAQVIKQIKVFPDVTAETAIKQSGLLDQFPEIDLSINKYGIFGKLVKPGTVLHQHDRIEIYRPLAVDPRSARQKRATQKKKIST